jgi:transposase
MSIATEQIRQRAIAAHLAGQAQSQVAKCYGVNIATFQRWLRRHRETGQDAPLPRGHNPPALDQHEMIRLGQLVRATPDATLAQLRGALGKTCSLVAIHMALKRLGYRFKKNASGQRTRSSGRQGAA